MAKRTDVHRPSVIIPEDYMFVGFACVKIEDLGSAHWALENRKAIQAHMASTGGKYSSHEHGGSCGVCGSVNAIYNALFHHVPTNTYVYVGQDCTDQLDAGVVPAFRTFVANARGAVEAAKGKKAAQKQLDDKSLGVCWKISSLRGDLGWEERTISDVVGKLVKYGSISEKQWGFLERLVQAMADRPAVVAKQAAEQAALADCPTGRVVVKGTMLSHRTEETIYGLTTKMLVQAATGYKVWCTMPTSIGTQHKGMEVEFTATLEPSRDDPKFGFGKRPTVTPAERQRLEALGAQSVA